MTQYTAAPLLFKTKAASFVMATVIGGASDRVAYRITYRKIPQIPKSITSFFFCLGAWKIEKARKRKTQKL
jgi:hypothetical protein